MAAKTVEEAWSLFDQFNRYAVFHFHATSVVRRGEVWLYAWLRATKPDVWAYVRNNGVGPETCLRVVIHPDDLAAVQDLSNPTWFKVFETLDRTLNA